MTGPRIETAGHGTGTATKAISAQTELGISPRADSGAERLLKMPMYEWLDLAEKTMNIKTSDGILKRAELTVLESGEFRGYVYRIGVKPSVSKDIEAVLKRNYRWRLAGSGISFSYTDECAEIRVTPGENARGDTARLTAYLPLIDKANLFGRLIQMQFEMGLEVRGIQFSTLPPHETLRKEPREMQKRMDPRAGDVPVIGIVLNRGIRHRPPNHMPSVAHIDPSFEIVGWVRKEKGKNAQKAKTQGPMIGYG